MKESYVRGKAHHSGPVGADAPFDYRVAATSDGPTPLSSEATWRHHLRQEPDASAALVRIY
jgi:hypothetical protein